MRKKIKKLIESFGKTLITIITAFIFLLVGSRLYPNECMVSQSTLNLPQCHNIPFAIFIFSVIGVIVIIFAMKKWQMT